MKRTLGIVGLILLMMFPLTAVWIVAAAILVGLIVFGNGIPVTKEEPKEDMEQMFRESERAFQDALPLPSDDEIQEQIKKAFWESELRKPRDEARNS